MQNSVFSQSYDAIIIGGGAFGLMCAVQAGYLGKRVLILERNASVGEKIKISGGGRCNYTNLSCESANYHSANEHFTKSALSQWTSQDTLGFFEANGIVGEEKTLGQIFPQSKNAREVVRLFESLCADLGQDILLRTEVLRVSKAQDLFSVSCLYQGEERIFQAPNVVVASGGLPVAKLGASDIALKIARSFGLQLKPTAPALVPLVVPSAKSIDFAKLSGISIFCEVSNQRMVFEENVLFTHWGLSGPAILQISTYWQKGETLYINFLPQKNIVDLLLHERQQNGKKKLGTYLSLYFPNRFCQEFLAKVLPLEKQLASLSNADLEQITSYIHDFEVRPSGDKGYDKAEVMRGGVDTNELSSKTLEAKKVKGLYFGGECVDVTGWLGGYNFQWAWACGYAVAQAL